MPIYGHSKRTTDSGLHEMSEVTFNVPLKELRRIARFLNDFADQVEAGTVYNDHVHLRDVDSEWNVDHPQSDVIAIVPLPIAPRPLD